MKNYKFLLLSLSIFLILSGCERKPTIVSETQTLSSVSTPTNTTVAEFTVPAPTQYTNIPVISTAKLPVIPTQATIQKNSWEGYLALLAHPSDQDYPNPGYLYLIKYGESDLTPVVQDENRREVFTTDVTWNPSGSLLTFTSNVENLGFLALSLDIQTMQVERFDTGILEGAGSQAISWSIDGRKFAFVQSYYPDTIYVASYPDLALTMIAQGLENESPLLTWDDRLVYLKNTLVDIDIVEGPSTILINNLDGREAVELLAGVNIHGLLSRSPDGRQITYVPADGQGLYILDLIYGKSRLLTNQVVHNSWDPNSNRLLLFIDCEVYFISLDGKESGKLEGLPEGYCYSYGEIQPTR